MTLDPTKHPDWQIALDAEQNMKTFEALTAEMGLEPSEVLPYGRYMGKIEQQEVLQRLENRPNGKYVDVTAITPTPLGEGKSTTTIGLVQGLARRGLRSSAAIRQPSGGPTMGMKGSAAGGGLSQCIPLTPYSLNFTGDIHAVGAAHNLAMTALTSRMQHERNYDDATLERLSGMRRLDIDPTRVSTGWVMDFCAQALRNVIIGMEGDGRRNDGFMMRSHFDITVASEVMSILSVARDLADLRQRMGRMVLALDRNGRPVTTADLEVDGAMTAWLVEAIKPNLIQTIEGQPVLVHTGPFGNIALGQSSVIADRVGLKLGDIHVTESGFAAEMGYEKFWNLKCRYSGLAPDAAVIVATVRALKHHGGAPQPRPGQPLPEEYLREDVGLVEAGCVNLLHHIGIVRRSGVPSVVCINKFYTDKPAEIAAIRRICEKAGASVAVSEHWEKGGEGGIKLAEEVIRLVEEPNDFTYSYELEGSIEDKLNQIVQKIYGGKRVVLTANAQKQAKQLEELGFGNCPICVAKTQYSLTDDQTKLGAPTDFEVTVRNLKISAGAGFIVALTGEIMTMPGLPKVPAAEKIDVDETGKITGLF